MKQNIMQFYLKKKKSTDASIDTSFLLFSFVHNLWLRHGRTCPSERIIKQKRCSSWHARTYKSTMSMTRALQTRALTSCRETKKVYLKINGCLSNRSTYVNREQTEVAPHKSVSSSSAQSAHDNVTQNNKDFKHASPDKRPMACATCRNTRKAAWNLKLLRRHCPGRG